MIENIKIRNFKSIRDASIDLNRINVLIGENGAGKSNFIAFFEFVKSIFARRLSQYILYRNGIDHLLYKGRRVSDYIFGFIDFDNINAFEFKILPAQGGEAFIEYTKHYFNQNYKEDELKQYQTGWHPVIWDSNVKESDILNNKKWRAEYLQDNLRSFNVYHFHDTSYNSKLRLPSRVADNQFLRPDGENLAAVLYKLKDSDITAFRIIEGTVRSIAPYFRQFRFVTNNTEKGETVSLEWEENNSDMYLNAYDLSDGTLRFIALATLLLQPSLPETIIIDEPELGLHPVAINKLAALIRRVSESSQIIVATQSVSVVNNFDVDEIIVVNRRDGQSCFDRLNPDDFKEWLDRYGSTGVLWEKNIIGGQP